jgi:hypothetical protein
VIMWNLAEFSDHHYRFFNRFNFVFYKALCKILCGTTTYDDALANIIQTNEIDVNIMKEISMVTCLSSQPRFPSRSLLFKKDFQDSNCVLIMQPFLHVTNRKHRILTNFMLYTSFEKRLVFGGKRSAGSVDKEDGHNSLLFQASSSTARMSTVVGGNMVSTSLARILVLLPARPGPLTLSDMIHASFEHWHVYPADNVMKLTPGTIVAIYDPLDIPASMESDNFIGKQPLWILAVPNDSASPNPEMFKYMNAARYVFQYNVLNRLGAFMTKTDHLYRPRKPMHYPLSEKCATIHVADVPPIRAYSTSPVLAFHSSAVAPDDDSAPSQPALKRTRTNSICDLKMLIYQPN